MATASRDLARTRGAARARHAALVALSVAFLVIVGFGGVEAVRLAEDLDDRRATALFYRADPAETAGETASAAWRSGRRGWGSRRRVCATPEERLPKGRLCALLEDASGTTSRSQARSAGPSEGRRRSSRIQRSHTGNSGAFT